MDGKESTLIFAVAYIGFGGVGALLRAERTAQNPIRPTTVRRGKGHQKKRKIIVVYPG